VSTQAEHGLLHGAQVGDAEMFTGDVSSSRQQQAARQSGPYEHSRHSDSPKSPQEECSEHGLQWAAKSALDQERCGTSNAVSLDPTPAGNQLKSDGRAAGVHEGESEFLSSAQGSGTCNEGHHSGLNMGCVLEAMHATQQLLHTPEPAILVDKDRLASTSVDKETRQARRDKELGYPEPQASTRNSSESSVAKVAPWPVAGGMQTTVGASEPDGRGSDETSIRTSFAHTLNGGPASVYNMPSASQVHVTIDDSVVENVLQLPSTRPRKAHVQPTFGKDSADEAALGRGRTSAEQACTLHDVLKAQVHSPACNSFLACFVVENVSAHEALFVASRLVISAGC
jgi:hypothetical protein